MIISDFGNFTAPPKIETIVIGGGHISPLEQPEEVVNLVKSLLS